MTIIEKLLVILVITILVIALAATRRFWQRFWQNLLFASLCVLVPIAFERFLELYDEYGDIEFHTVTVGWLLFGGLASCSLLIWSIWGFRHHKVRTVVGFAVCFVTALWMWLGMQTILYSKG